MYGPRHYLYKDKYKLCYGTQRVISSGQDSAILPFRVANHSAEFGSPRPFKKEAI